MARCRQCGKCCKVDFFAFVKPEDLARWRDEGRFDILKMISTEKPFWAGDRLISASDGRPLRECPFLAWSGEKYCCTIYETRPRICREFQPGSARICPEMVKIDEGNEIL